jgi:hypothetical protein
VARVVVEMEVVAAPGEVPMVAAPEVAAPVAQVVVQAVRVGAVNKWPNHQQKACCGLMDCSHCHDSSQ